MNKYHEEQLNNIKAYIERIERDNKFLRNEMEIFDDLRNEIERLCKRIDKAIEILEVEKKSQELTNNGFCACSICHALDILKGSDSNEIKY